MINKLKLVAIFLFAFMLFLTFNSEVLAKTPISPLNFNVSSNGNFNTLRWSLSPGASGYYLYKAGCRVGRLSSATKTYIDNMVGCGGGEIKYAIAAYNSEGTSLPSTITGKNRISCGCDEIDFNRNHMIDTCKLGVISSTCAANPQPGSDLYIFKANYDKNSCFNYLAGDVNKDYRVDLLDFTIYSTWFTNFEKNSRYYCSGL